MKATAYEGVREQLQFNRKLNTRLCSKLEKRGLCALRPLKGENKPHVTWERGQDVWITWKRSDKRFRRPHHILFHKCTHSFNYSFVYTYIHARTPRIILGLSHRKVMNGKHRLQIPANFPQLVITSRWVLHLWDGKAILRHDVITHDPQRSPWFRHRPTRSNRLPHAHKTGWADLH